MEINGAHKSLKLKEENKDLKKHIQRTEACRTGQVDSRSVGAKLSDAQMQQACRATPLFQFLCPLLQ